MLNRVCQDIPLNEKITTLYSPVLKIEKGDKILGQIQKKIQEINIKINEQIHMVKVNFEEPKFTTIAKICQSNKQNHIYVGEKAPKIPSKDKIDESFHDNSFICGFNSREISMIVEDP